MNESRSQGVFDDRLLADAVRTTEGQSFAQARRLSSRQRWIVLAISLITVGAIVGLIIQARQPDPYSVSKPVRWNHPVVANGGRDVIVTFSVDSCGQFIDSFRTEVREMPTKVVVTVIVVSNYPDRSGLCAGSLIHGKAVALLGHPLGSRKLVDGAR